MDETRRCPWAKSEHEAAYHDNEWCRPCRDDKALFELLELEGFQAGLTWRLILERRQALNAAFAGFDPAVLAGWGEAEIAAALAAPGGHQKQEQGPVRRHQRPGLSAGAGGVGAALPATCGTGWTACRWITGWSGRRTCRRRTTCPGG